jgi:hypothetical protein
LRRLRTFAWAIALSAALAVPLTAFAVPDLYSRQRNDSKRAVVQRKAVPLKRKPRKIHAPVHRDNAKERFLDAYRGVAAWIDIYNARPWSEPARAVRRMHHRGVTTVFLQTGNYASRGPIYRPRAVTRFLAAAHRRDMKVVAWYLPSFRKLKIDLRRSLVAVRFRRGGERFDSFAMDIESPIVDSISVRNRRLRWLSWRLRRAIGRKYPLGAIVPDYGSTYWPRFPYRAVARRYDVFLPMAYFTFRTNGRGGVRRYIDANFRWIRRSLGKRDVPIHMIGGIAGITTPQEMKGFVKSVKDHKALGASLYDFPISAGYEWKELARIAGPAARKHPKQAPKRRRRPALVPLFPADLERPRSEARLGS